MAIDKVVYDRLLGVLDLVTRGDTDSQRFLNENLNAFESGRSDTCVYYLEVSLGSSNFHVRQMSLLLLKRSLSREWPRLDVDSKRGLYDGVFRLLGISTAETRSVVSSCLVTLYGLQNGRDSKVLAKRLLDVLLAESHVEVLEAASLALSMIVEDVLSVNGTDGYRDGQHGGDGYRDGQHGGNGYRDGQHGGDGSTNSGTPDDHEKFLFLKTELAKSVLQIAASRPGLHGYLSRVLLIMVDSREVAEHVLSHHFDLIWSLLGSISTLDDSGAKKFVLKCLLRIWDYKPRSILQVVFPLITTSCKDGDPQVQIEALDLLSHILQSVQYSDRDGLQGECLGMLRSHLPTLVGILVDNTKYTSWDYMSMDISHIEDDNASKPDSAQDVMLHGQSNQEETSTWGNTWTVRKGAALALDNLSQAYGGDPDVLGIFLRHIQANLDSPDWEVKESAVLTLGAISRGSLSALFPFLPKVVDYLVVLSGDSKPLLRIISCWCISRFTHFLFTSPRQLETSLHAILNRMLDTNKRVQEGACSAFTAFEETCGAHLVPYLDYILETILRALEIYQERNFRILYDVIGTLAQNVGEPLLTIRRFPDLMARFMELLATTDVYKPQFLALLECMSCISQLVGSGMAIYASRVLQKCVEAMRAILEDAKDEDLPEPPRWDVVEFASDTISSLVSSLGASPADVSALIDGSGQGLVGTILEACKHGHSGVLQSCIALLGDLGWIYGAVFAPPVAKLLTDNMLSEYPSVANNAVWAIGVLSMHEKRGVLLPSVPAIVLHLSHLLDTISHQTLIVQNVCITLGRICLNFPNEASTMLPKFLHKFCLHMTSYRNDLDKAQALQGIASAVGNSPALAAQHMAELAQLFLSYPPCDFENVLGGALLAVVRTNGPAWETVHHSIKNGAKARFNV